MQENGLDLRAIHPRNGEKYSPNLYAWLTLRTKKHRASAPSRHARGHAQSAFRRLHRWFQ